MPAAVAAFIWPTIAGIISSVTVAATVTTILAYTIVIGAVVGASMLALAIFGPSLPKPSGNQTVVRQAVGSRKRSYGIVETAGQLSFEESANGTLAMVVTQGTGEETEILQHKINGEKVNVSASGTVTDPTGNTDFKGAIHVYTRLGTDDQTAIAELTAKFPKWTSAHRQRGCTHAAIICEPVKQKYFSTVYNGQMPAYTSTRKAVKIYDPRKDSTRGGAGSHRLNDKSTWEWTDNGPLVVADYVAHPDGYGLGYDSINWDNIAAEADIADQDVLTVTEETIKRWRIWATYSLADDERRQILTSMLNAIDGFCWQGPDFKFNLHCGRFEEPDITITDDHILSSAPSFGPDVQKRVSGLKMLYTEAAIGYKEQESTLVSVPGINEDPNTNVSSVQLYYAPHHNQAVRVGKIMGAQLGSRWHLDLTLNLFGLDLLGRRFCRVASASFGLDAFFAIEGGVKLNISDSEITIGVTLVEVRAADWDFDAATEEGTPPIAPDEDSDGNLIVIPVPTGLALTAVQLQLGDAYGVAISARWDQPSRPDLVFQAHYRPTSGGDWIMMTVDDDACTATSSVVNSGVEYEVQVLALTIAYRESDWSASVTITPVAETALGAPGGLSATPGGTGAATIKFRMPTTPSLSFARLYHSATNDSSTMTQVGADIPAGALGEWITVTDSGLPSGAQYYWVRAYDGAGGSSALVGPASATIS